jgi:hypothetical protein
MCLHHSTPCDAGGACSASHPPTSSKMQSCCPKLLGPSAAMIASPPLKSRLHLLPRGRGRRSYSPWRNQAEGRRCRRGRRRRERAGGGDRKLERERERCMMEHDDGVVDLFDLALLSFESRSHHQIGAVLPPPPPPPPPPPSSSSLSASL